MESYRQALDARACMSTLSPSHFKWADLGTITITENPLAAGNLYMDYSVDLTKVSDNHYVCEGQSSSTASILSSLISFCGVNSDYFSNTVERMKVDAQFDGSSTLTLKITYLAEILGVEAEIGVSTFTGTKIEE